MKMKRTSETSKNNLVISMRALQWELAEQQGLLVRLVEGARQVQQDLPAAPDRAAALELQARLDRLDQWVRQARLELRGLQALLDRME